MLYDKQSKAKAIVHEFFCTYSRTISDLELAIRNIWINNAPPKTIQKREELIKKKFKEFDGNIIVKQGKATFSTLIALATITHNESNQTQTLSRSERNKSRTADQKYKLHQHSLTKQFFNVFIVKNNDNSNLNILMFNPRAKKPHELSECYSLATITRHCLERIIERMDLKTVDEALEEIVTSLQWLDCSTTELLVRNKDIYKNIKFKRHIPTTNGALLLTNYSKDDFGTKPVLESHLVTWIHKRQFFDDQEVTRSDFNFAQAINYILSSPKKEDEINKYKSGASELNSINEPKDMIVNINGYTYTFERFISALECGEYLDFIIDFDKSS